LFTFGLLSVQLVTKISNGCDHNPAALQTDNSNLCAYVGLAGWPCFFGLTQSVLAT